MNIIILRQVLLIVCLATLFVSCNEKKQSLPETTVVTAENNENKIQIIAVNGSPRDNENTATLCKFFLDGAKSANGNVETTLINIYDVDFKGCTSCFGCKMADSENYGKCVMQDELTPILEKIAKADGLVLASPIYFGEITGELRSFMERLVFPYSTYEASRKTLAPKRFPTAMIYTMNVTKEGAEESGYNEYFDKVERLISRIYQKPQQICAYNTYQFDDYSKYKADLFSEEDKKQYKETQFPIDCQSAFDAGKQMVDSILHQ